MAHTGEVEIQDRKETDVADSSHLIANFIVLCVFTKKKGKDLTKDNK